MLAVRCALLAALLAAPGAAAAPGRCSAPGKGSRAPGVLGQLADGGNRCGHRRWGWWGDGRREGRRGDGGPFLWLV